MKLSWLTVIFLIFGLTCQGQDRTYTAFYPSPSGKYRSIRVFGKLAVGIEPEKSFGIALEDEANQGMIFADSIIFRRHDDFPSDPLEGELLWVSNPADNTTKMWTYKNGKWEMVPFFPLTSIKVKVDTNLPDIQVCGEKVGNNEWTYCLLGPELIDVPYTENTFSICRSCDLDSCTIRAYGQATSSFSFSEDPFARVDIVLYDTEAFSLKPLSDISLCKKAYSCSKDLDEVHASCTCDSDTCEVYPFLSLEYAPSQ